MSILVIAEHDNSELNAVTLNIITAAGKLSGDVHVLVAGQNCSAVADAAASAAGVVKVLVADQACFAHFTGENMGGLIAELGAEYSHILAPATTNGKNYLPRAAALLDVEQISEVVEIESDDTFKRPIYAGNAIATVKSSDKIKVMTVRGTAYDATAATGGSAEIVALTNATETGLTSFVSEDLAKSDRPDLAAAKVIIAGGRGMQSAENFALLESIADKLGAAVGASRAAVDAGFVPNDLQVGQTGKIVAPDLYIAVGISGAIQHLAGMKDSKIIVAINKDEDAPIFQVADYGLVADLFEAIPELDAAL